MLFRLIANPEFTGDKLMGYEWIDVLAMEPWAIRPQPETELGEWAAAEIAVQYICRIPSVRGGGTELVRFAADDLWTALGEREDWIDEEGRSEYIEERPQEVPALEEATRAHDLHMLGPR
jgi:hypothetical protein